MDNVDVHMDGCCLVILAKIERHKLIGADHPIDKVRATLNHTLVDEFLKGFVHAAHTDVEEELVPEACVDKVAGAVLRAADIEIDILPIFISLLRYQLFIVLRIHVTEIVGTGAGKSEHGAILARIAVPSPILGAGERRFAGLSRQELVHLRQNHRQLGLRNGIRHPFFVIDGERFTPIALAAEDSVAQTVVHRTVTDTHVVNLGNHRLAALFDGHPGDKAGIDAHAGLAVKRLLPCVGVAGLIHGGRHNLTDRQIEMACKRKVAAVVGRHCHDGTGAVVRKHIIANPDGDALLRDGIDGE